MSEIKKVALISSILLAGGLGPPIFGVPEVKELIPVDPQRIPKCNCGGTGRIPKGPYSKRFKRCPCTFVQINEEIKP